MFGGAVPDFSKVAGAVGGGGGLGSILGGVTSFLGGPWGMALNALGGLFGNGQAMKHLDEGRTDVLDLPGMSGPSNLMGDFGVSANGAFGFNNPMLGAQQGISGSLGNLFGASNPFANMDFGGLFNDASNALSQQIGPGNALSSGAGAGLLGMGLQNMLNAGNTQGIYDNQLQLMRSAYAPEQERQQNQLLDSLYAKGLLAPNTDVQSGNAMTRTYFDQQNQMENTFQQAAFGRAQAEAQRLGALGQGQVGQAFGAENQAFSQALQALQQNQSGFLQRMGAAQGLFGMGQDAFAQNYGLGLQGAESLLGYADFGLRGAAMPFQLQAALLSGGGQHADALAALAAQKAKQSSGFFGSLFG